MPRNASGACTVEEAAFTPNTPITAAATNSNNDDFAEMLTDSLSRTGKGGMSVALPLSPGGFIYSGDPDTGMSRTAANTQVITVGGEDYTFTADDVTAPNGLSLLPLIGEIRMWALPTAPTGWLLMQGQVCTTARPLWRAALIAAGSPYGTSGSDPLFPNMQCVVPAGFDASSRGLLTGSNVLGVLLGAQSRVIGHANLPDVTFSNTLGVNDARSWSWSAKRYTITGGAGAPQDVVDPAGTPPNLDVGVTPTGSISITGSVTSGGSGTALPIVQPTLVINFIGRDA